MLFLRDPWPDTVPALTSELYIPGGKQGIESEENRRNQQRSGNAAKAIETRAAFRPLFVGEAFMPDAHGTSREEHRD
jgi:hypothetical protein